MPAGVGKVLNIYVSNVAPEVAVEPHFADFLDLDVALEELARCNERQARVVELRYFGGLENAEVAEVLGVSEDTVMRDWKFSRAWLFKRLHNS